MASCTVSPLAFTMAIKVITRASKCVTTAGLCPPPIRAYMDDMTTLTNADACTKQLLGKPQENIKWAWMNIKPSKSRGISIVEGLLRDIRFCFGSLKDKEQVQLLRQGIVDYLEIINKSLHPGKLKLLATSRLWSPKNWQRWSKLSFHIWKSESMSNNAKLTSTCRAEGSLRYLSVWQIQF